MESGRLRNQEKIILKAHLNIAVIPGEDFCRPPCAISAVQAVKPDVEVNWVSLRSLRRKKVRILLIQRRAGTHTTTYLIAEEELRRNQWPVELAHVVVGRFP